MEVDSIKKRKEKRKMKYAYKERMKNNKETAESKISEMSLKRDPVRDGKMGSRVTQHGSEQKVETVDNK